MQIATLHTKEQYIVVRILIHHRIGSRDGQSVHLEELVAAFQRRGHETILVGPASLSTVGFGQSDSLVDLVKRWAPASVFELLEMAYNVRAAFRLWKSVRDNKPDIIYERFSLFLLAGLWISRLFHIPLLLEVNSPLYEERLKNDGLRLLRMGRWSQHKLWNGAHHVLPVTHVLARTMRHYGVAAASIDVVPNGIDPRKFEGYPEITLAKQELNLSNRLVLGFSGFIRAWNAVQLIIDFVAAHCSTIDLHLLIVGDGPARDELYRHAEARNVLDRVTVTGVVGRDEVRRYVAAFDVAVLPGVTPYSSPLKLFEYMHLGRAIVAPDMDNVLEILKHESNALLFDPAIHGSMEATLLRACLSMTLRMRLGCAAQKTLIEKSLTWDHNADRITSLAESAIAQFRKRHSL